jgi:hypothetical protein
VTGHLALVADNDALRDLPAGDDELRDQGPVDEDEAGRDLLRETGERIRTLADVPDDPPGPLLLGMLEDGATVGYAAPGTGKGATGAVLIVRAQREGMRMGIYDAERRPREWSRRVSGQGGDRSQVIYIEPTDLPTAYRGKPLWEAIEPIGRIIAAAGVDILIVDSIMPATGVGEDRLRSDAQVPFLWVAALDSLRIPSLSFGHPPKGQPEGEPFGSFAWVAAPRLTWLGVKAEGDGHRIRWRPKKRNERGHIPGILLTVHYGVDGRPDDFEWEDDEESTRDWLLASLVSGPRTVADLAEEQVDQMESPPAGEIERTKERLGKALRRMAKDGWVEKMGERGRGVRWGLRERSVSGYPTPDRPVQRVRTPVRIEGDVVRTEREPRPDIGPSAYPDSGGTRRVPLSGGKAGQSDDEIPSLVDDQSHRQEASKSSPSATDHPGPSTARQAEQITVAHVIAADEPAQSVTDCRDQVGHQSSHRRVGARWICDECAPPMPGSAESWL